MRQLYHPARDAVACKSSQIIVTAQVMSTGMSRAASPTTRGRRRPTSMEYGMKRLVSVFVLILATAGTVQGQIHTGSITGVVKDEQGGVRPGAVVTAQAADATRTIN